MGDINTSTLKKFLKATGMRAKPESIKLFGEKLSEYANDLANVLAVNAKAKNRKTIFPEDFTMEETETNETVAPEETTESEESADAETTEAEESTEAAD